MVCHAKAKKVLFRANVVQVLSSIPDLLRHLLYLLDLVVERGARLKLEHLDDSLEVVDH